MKCETLVIHGWCSACYAAKRGREAGHRKLPRRPEPVFNPFEESDMGMRRPDGAATPPGGPLLTDEVFSGFYPRLTEHLTETAWEDGKPRKTSTMLFFVENGRWKCHFHDRDGKRGFWVTSEAWEGLLDALEKAVNDSSTEWRKDLR